MVMFKTKFAPRVASQKPQAQQQQQPQEKEKAPPIEKERGPQYPVKEPEPRHAPERAGRAREAPSRG